MAGFPLKKAGQTKKWGICYKNLIVYNIHSDPSHNRRALSEGVMSQAQGEIMIAVGFCYFLMIGGGFSITAGICLADKLRERKLARMPEVAKASHQFRT
ncbi:MAG: hypothetical protein Greene101449_1210 [Candidatus Peregrinibacteria bacterium Greene1014_49]|nr:MAG: hypothetical protein Greene101449_1210 [Candidatus Peregrinibacteria bacterium Greene1014_49]